MTGEQAPLLDLYDIVLPERVRWVPQTPGWWILLGVLVIAVCWATYSAIRRWQTNRYRRLALERLARIEQDLATPSSRDDAMMALPVLVKQTALAFRPRTHVAALSGDSWLHFLDESYGGSGFSKGPGRLLPKLAYSTPATTNTVPVAELEALVDLVRRWIRRHRVRV
jgi:hypothetical protein